MRLPATQGGMILPLDKTVALTQNLYRRIKSENTRLRRLPAAAFPEISEVSLCLPQWFPLRRPRAALFFLMPNPSPECAPLPASLKAGRPDRQPPRLFNQQSKINNQLPAHPSLAPGNAPRTRNGLQRHPRPRCPHRRPPPRMPDRNLRPRLFRTHHLIASGARRRHPPRRILRSNRCQRRTRSPLASPPQE